MDGMKQRQEIASVHLLAGSNSRRGSVEEFIASSHAVTWLQMQTTGRRTSQSASSVAVPDCRRSDRLEVYKMSSNQPAAVPNTESHDTTTDATVASSSKHKTRADSVDSNDSDAEDDEGEGDEEEEPQWHKDAATAAQETQRSTQKLASTAVNPPLPPAATASTGLPKNGDWTAVWSPQCSLYHSIFEIRADLMKTDTTPTTFTTQRPTSPPGTTPSPLPLPLLQQPLHPHPLQQAHQQPQRQT